MNPFKESKIITRSLGASAISAALCLSAVATAQPSQGQVVGTTYTPSGADYSITALQGINSSNPTGTSGTAQVNLNFEMTPSIGVSYAGANGQLTNFGLGLYTLGGGPGPGPGGGGPGPGGGGPGPGGGGPGPGGGGTVYSTGLDIQYNSLVSAASANLTLEDFDLQGNATGFKSQKVEPLISIYGANNTLLGTANPTQIFNAFTNTSSANDFTATVNMGTLLSEMGSSSTAVSKVVLSADSANGETTKSDPYLLRSVGKAQPVPEPASFGMLAVGGLLLVRRRAKSAA